MIQFLLIALATFVSEDLTCIATGALIAAGKLGFLPGVLACIAGIYLGDLLLYIAGRWMGRPLVRWKPLRRILTPQKLDRASEWLSERGASVVILSRFTPGLRLPTYVAAGLLKTRFWTFAAYFFVAATLWTPVLVGAAAVLGKSLPHMTFLGPALLLVAAPWRKILRDRPPWHTRRRAIGWMRRKTRWEFWPAWLAYIPVAPYILYLGLKHRSLTLFTAANPGIPSGGFAGESKSGIMTQLIHVPDFTLIAASLACDDRFQAARTFMQTRQLSYPVVLKPDMGERGTGVVIVRSDDEVRRYLEGATRDTIVQRYAGGLEFGVFYYRYPGQPRGRIFSITRKLFPEVTGDGRSTLTDLVLRDDRAVCLANIYLAKSRDRIPAAGERVRLVELGSHCRGAIFLDGAGLETEGLRAAIESVARSHPGFFFGRFDVRAETVADLQAGRFHVLELNGVSAEPTHIYDPAVSVVEAYRVMFRQWRIAFEIGAMNRDAGVAPMPLRDLLRMVRSGRAMPSGDRQSAGSYDLIKASCRRAVPERP
jgi:membrane protein DedA with SNARE-associated domain